MNANIIIPFMFDSEDRLRNLFRALFYLTYKFPDVKIFVLNQDVNDSYKILLSYYEGYNFNNVQLINLEIPRPFYKSKLINTGINYCTEDVVIIYDCDVLIPAEQLELSVKFCQEDYSLVYPYSNPQYNVPQYRFVEFMQDYDFKQMENTIPPYQMLHNHNKDNYPVIGYAPGFCLTINKEKLGRYAYYNEEYVGWGWEDAEYIFKMDFLNIKMTRVYGPVFHFEHKRTESDFPEAINKNFVLYKKTLDSTKDELKKYYGEKDEK